MNTGVNPASTDAGGSSAILRNSAINRWRFNSSAADTFLRGQWCPHDRIDAPWHVPHSFLPPNRFELNRQKAITLSSNSTPQTSQPGLEGIFWHFWHNFLAPNLFEFRRQELTTFVSIPTPHASHQSTGANLE